MTELLTRFSAPIELISSGFESFELIAPEARADDDLNELDLGDETLRVARPTSPAVPARV